jgi:hypothetical protein
MTVKELIRELQTCPEDYEVMTWTRSGDIEAVRGISAVCEDTKTIAISGDINWPSNNIFKLEIPGIN